MENKKDNNLVEIEIKATQREAKSGANKGQKFYSYKGLTKDLEYVDLKFTKEVKNAPEKDCIIVVPRNKVNYIGRDRRKYPLTWVQEIVEIKEKYNPNDVKEDDDLPF
jgi:hypothetical protein